MSSPTISVIIPAYNHERFVGAAVSSVLAQSEGDLELIVIDDGSTDGTGAVVRAIRDPRLSYHHQANQDAFNALNRGLAMARGRYVAILNSDDVYEPARLKILMQRQRDTGAACLFTDVIPIDAGGRALPASGHYWQAWHQANRRFYFECGDLYAAFLKGNLLVTTSNLFLTAEAARAVGPFAALRYLHDYEYIFRVLLAYPGRVLYLHDAPLLQYRLHGCNTLHQGAREAREQNRALVRTYLLAGLPPESRPRAEAGAQRLVELEAELAAVRRQQRIPRLLRPALDALYRRFYS